MNLNQISLQRIRGIKMLIRILTGICGIAVIYLGIMVKNDRTGKYSSSLREKYTDSSVNKYLHNSFNAELFFGIGLIIEAVFGSGFGYWFGLLVQKLKDF